MKDTVQNALADLRRALEDVYGNRLYGLYLYGSCARGEQEWDSDLDLLVILDQIKAYGAEIDRTSELVSSVSLRYGISVSRVFVSQKEWRDVKNGFLSQVRQEAIAA